AIIAVFNVECEGKDRSVVINVSDTFVSGLPDLPINRAAGTPGASLDSSRSYLSEVKAFPTNIEVRSLLTFRAGGGFGPPGPGAGGGGGAKSVTALVHHSLAILPETPMQGRLFDPRVGYFTEEYVDYAHPKQWAVPRQFITRFRLEKKDPKAAVSEVVKPITFYLSKEIPEKWRPYLKKGVEDWAPVFEKAGFKNAIVCKDAPTRAEDPNWDPEDARHSVIRWVAEPVQNAMGPHVHDPRSGEIISAHIIFWHDIVKTAQIWYFLQCGAVDPKVRKFPLPDDVTGAMMRYICAHEVGHTLGLRHNHRASTAFSVSQLRDPKFCAEFGSVASIMSYGRCNYVAQPEDKVNPKHLLPKIGPYDNFAIEWGYKPIPTAKTPDEERKALDTWASKQLENPFLRFGGEDGPSRVDPTVLTENIGNDPIQVTTCGLKNLDRVLDFLLAATTEKGEDYTLLAEVYSELLGQRSLWFGAVAKQVGGVVEYRTLGGRGGEAFVRVPKEKQKEAVKFLLDNAFTTPTKLLNPGLVNQFKYTGASSDIARQQRFLLNNLLGSNTLGRLADAELLDPDKAYTAVELVNDLQSGLFSELKSDAPKIDPLRRQLQRAYIDILKAEFTPSAAGTPPISLFRTPTELRAIARQSLGKLADQLTAAKAKAKDPITVAHIDDLQSEIKAILATDKK
ncbi:MAG: zinc-dependent metalloprotease, partial [Planctomycetia bacterium]|nr:zinc-dependent metalloprotease [Planctomycetia bacterium]